MSKKMTLQQQIEEKVSRIETLETLVKAGQSVNEEYSKMFEVQKIQIAKLEADLAAAQAANAKHAKGMLDAIEANVQLMKIVREIANLSKEVMTLDTNSTPKEMLLNSVVSLATALALKAIYLQSKTESPATESEAVKPKFAVGQAIRIDNQDYCQDSVIESIIFCEECQDFHYLADTEDGIKQFEVTEIEAQS